MSNEREFPLHPLAAVSVAVVRDHAREQQVLLVRRGHEPWKGHWSLPGGLVELGEPVRLAAAREVREETSLDVAIGDVLGVHDRLELTPDGRVQYHYVLIVFRARPHTPSAQPTAASDASAVRWTPLTDLATLPLTPDLEAILSPLIVAH